MFWQDVTRTWDNAKQDCYDLGGWLWVPRTFREDVITQDLIADKVVAGVWRNFDSRSYPSHRVWLGIKLRGNMIEQLIVYPNNLHRLSSSPEWADGVNDTVKISV